MALQLDERTLLDQFLATRSPELREQLILQSVPLVHFMLSRMGISPALGTEYEDLTHQGLLGLIDAVDRYDPSHGAQFSTYATLRIRGKVLDYLRSSDRLSRSTRQRARVIQKAMGDLWTSLEREPTEEEIASYLNIDKDKVQHDLLELNTVFVSLDAMSDTEQDQDGDLHERLMDDKQPDPSVVSEDQALKHALVTGIKKLSEREQLILSLYYYDELTFKEIGQVLNLTESRVCQLHARAILNLKVMVNHE